jgi:hypothetical protein
MRIVNVAVRQCYRFNCPNCGSKLEADSDELVDVGSGVLSAERKDTFRGLL